jgi:nitrogen PTS system EIIA component
MDLSLRDAAKLLATTEDNLLRWIQAGTIPAQRVNHQYRLNRVELLEWAATQDHRVSPELLRSNDGELPCSLAGALERGGIFSGVPGTSREEVLEAITHLPGIPDGVDRTMLYQLLLAREKLASTGLGQGIALPHPRAPVILRLDAPHVLLCFPTTPVDFGAIDRMPVRVLVLLLAPSVRIHLQLLAKLAFALHDERLKQALSPSSPPEMIVRRIRQLEQEPTSCSRSF